MVNIFGNNNRLTRVIGAGVNSLSPTDKYLICDATAGSLSIELLGIREYISVLQDNVGNTLNISVFLSNETPLSSSNTVTISSTLGETINGASSIVLPSNSDFILFATPAGWLLVSGGSGSNIVISATLNLSNTSIYDATTRKVTIPTLSKSADIFICKADLYSPTRSYVIGEIVRSDGSYNGVDKKCYKSLTNGNFGNNLNDPINWVYADDGTASNYGSVGNLEVSTFGNPNSLPENHNSAFRINDGTFGILFISGGSNPSIGQLFLDVNTDVLISNKYSEFTFANVFDVCVKQPAPMQ